MHNPAMVGMANTVQEEIPVKHKAAIFSNPGTTQTEVIEVDTPEPTQGEVLIKLTHSGVCHSDYAFITNAWSHMPESTPKGQIGGHEGIGIVVKLGPGVRNRQIGDRVGVKWITSTCLTCEACLQGNESKCPSKKVSGYKAPGTFQQYVCSDASYVTTIPQGIDSAEAAPLLCGGVTVFNALQSVHLKAGDTVAISGAGGGLGHLGIQYGKAMGLEIIAIDHGSKKDFCLSLGASGFIDFMQHDDAGLVQEVKRLSQGGCNAVLVTNGSVKAYDQALEFLGFGGTMVCVGVPAQAQPIKLALPNLLITSKLTIKGQSSRTSSHASWRSQSGPVH